MVLRGSGRVVAVALAERITKDEQRKLILRCAVCNYRRVDVRKRNKPLSYRCRHGHAFSTPIEEWTRSSHRTVPCEYSYARRV